MRRALLAATTLAVALTTGTTLLPGGAAADPTDPTGPAGPADPGTSAAPAPVEVPTRDEAEETLAAALDTLGADPAGADRAPEPPAPAGEEPADASVALRDLWQARVALAPSDRRRADALLARPTDRLGDQFGDGYRTADTRRTCARTVCVTRAVDTSDAATAAFAARTLQVVQDVHDHHVDRLGWRAPRADGRRGGNAKFDVYLADLGSDGLYGYCAPDDGTSPRTRVADGYCVLDNDFSRREFPRNSPDDNLRVTAAHEYLHAIQFAYDATEDGWLLEATATWMEEQYADDVDDNRQYLSSGQLRQAEQPLDRSSGRGTYGNWIFFEHLANRFGPRVVRQVWERAAAYPGAPDDTSTGAVASVLERRGTTLRRAYALFAGDNLDPAHSALYPEGDAWGRGAPVVRTATLGPDRRSTGRWTQRVDHLASRTVAVSSRRLGDAARLSVRLDGPPGASSPAVQLTVRRTDGSTRSRFVPLDGPAGTRTVRVDFASSRVDRVSLTLVNASRRFRCDRGTTYTCGGAPLDDGRVFALTARVVR